MLWFKYIFLLTYILKRDKMIPELITKLYETNQLSKEQYQSMQPLKKPYGEKWENKNYNPKLNKTINVKFKDIFFKKKYLRW